jgi:hypothetical protein
MKRHLLLATALASVALHTRAAQTDMNEPVLLQAPQLALRDSNRWCPNGEYSPEKLQRAVRTAEAQLVKMAKIAQNAQLFLPTGTGLAASGQAPWFVLGVPLGLSGVLADNAPSQAQVAERYWQVQAMKDELFRCDVATGRLL